MPVVELLDRIDSRELTEWGLFFDLKNTEAIPDEERVVVHGLDDRGDDGDHEDDEDDEPSERDVRERDPLDPFDV